MAYNKVDFFNKAKEVIISNKLFFIEDVVAYLGCAKPTFYDHFPIDSNEMNELKQLLEKNRIDTKISMRTKWFDSDHPTLQVALMKIIGTDEEVSRLNGSSTKLDVTTKGESINNTIQVEIVKSNESNDSI